MCWWRNTKDKFWFTFDITSKLRGKIVGIQQKKEWHWLWKSGIIWLRHSSALTLKWDVSVARMSKLSHFLQKELKEIYSQHLAEKMSECVACLCYGCVHAKDSSLMHNLCNMHASDQVTFISSAEPFLNIGSSGLMVTFSHSTKIDMSPLDMDLKCVNFGGACVNFGGAV